MLADELFEADTALSDKQDEVLDTILDVLQIDKSEPGEWGFEDWTYDYYDRSFEIKKAYRPIVVTKDMYQKFKAMGFSRCWICYGSREEEADYREEFHFWG